ncbi:ubiquitin-conjugating enzyme/RWD-like protein [Mycena sp. CBHHK59/15]|nr:ubiquitin-conjugating enzyme/RWD-like protein [Mycena sp. CBHHK59/15]
MAQPGPATLKRIHREISDVKKEDLGDITLVPSDDLFVWRGTLPGPEGSVYEGGVFNVAVNLPPDYPFSAPKVTFKTRFKISDQGNICIDILKHNWSPALSLFKVILSLSSLLTDPNPIPSIAAQYTRNRKLHDSTARQWTELKIQVEKKATTSNTGAATTAGPIIIDDSDDEGQRGRSAAGRKRKRDTVAVEIDLVDDNDDEEVTQVASGSKKRAVDDGRNPRAGAGSSHTRRPPPIAQGDVIDIDDD